MRKTLYYGGHIITCNLQNSIAEAMVTEDEKILFVGKYREARHLIDADTEILHIGGRAIIAGFFDSMGGLCTFNASEQFTIHSSTFTFQGITSLAEQGNYGAMSLSILCREVWQKNLPIRITAMIADTPEAPDGALATMLSCVGIRSGVGDFQFRLGSSRISIPANFAEQNSEANQLSIFLSHLLSCGIAIQLEPQNEKALEKALAKK